MVDSTRQWMRIAQLIVGKGKSGLLIENLRFQFEIVKTLDEKPNNATIKIYNLHPDKEGQIKNEYQDVYLNAGYRGAEQQIFTGNIKYVYHYRSGTDRITEIEAGDGDADYKKSIINETLAAGTDDETLINKAVNTMPGTQKGHVKVSKKQRIRGRVVSGNTRDILRKIAKENGVQWSIQDGHLIMVPVKAMLPEAVFVINAETGMIDTPETNDKGISVKTLLNPALKIAGSIKLDNNNIRINRQKTRTLQTKREKLETNRPLGREDEQLSRLSPDGIYKIISVTHKGDTRANEWYSELECISV
jgi:hypothetical protein